jgi:hypothetical protein
MKEPDVYQQNLERITQIEEAVDKMVNEWDLETLIHFACVVKVDYFCQNADKEEVQELLRTWGKE